MFQRATFENQMRIMSNKKIEQKNNGSLAAINDTDRSLETSPKNGYNVSMTWEVK